MDYEARVKELSAMKKDTAGVDQAAEDAYQAYCMQMESFPEQVQALFDTWDALKTAGFDRDFKHDYAEAFPLDGFPFQNVPSGEGPGPRRAIVLGGMKPRSVFSDGHILLHVNSRDLVFPVDVPDVTAFRDLLEHSSGEDLVWTAEDYESFTNQVWDLLEFWEEFQNEFLEYVDDIIEHKDMDMEEEPER